MIIQDNINDFTSRLNDEWIYFQAQAIKNVGKGVGPNFRLYNFTSIQKEERPILECVLAEGTNDLENKDTESIYKIVNPDVSTGKVLALSSTALSSTASSSIYTPPPRLELLPNIEAKKIFERRIFRLPPGVQTYYATIGGFGTTKKDPSITTIKLLNICLIVDSDIVALSDHLWVDNDDVLNILRSIPLSQNEIDDRIKDFQTRKKDIDMELNELMSYSKDSYKYEIIEQLSRSDIKKYQRYQQLLNLRKDMDSRIKIKFTATIEQYSDTKSKLINIQNIEIVENYFDIFNPNHYINRTTMLNH